jgi:hypothetical protein
MTFLRQLVRRPEWPVAAILFAGLLGLSWRRWASFDGDLNREWTTPARVAAGERLYKDVAYYYGPLAPYAEAVAFRTFGSRVGTAIGFGILAAAGTLALILGATGDLLRTPGRLGVATVTVGILAFAPENGALVACYSQAALLAVGLSWLAFLLSRRGVAAWAGLAGGLALLAKIEAAPALLGPLLLLDCRGRIRFASMAAGVALAGYGIAIFGIPLVELVSYGPLRHLVMPPEFRELYLRVSGLHPALLASGISGAVVGLGLAGGWLLGVGGLLARRGPRAAAGLAFLAAGVFLQRGRAPEEFLTTAIRGLPLLLLMAFAVATWELLLPGEEARRRDEARLALATCLVGVSFAWRTAFWTVPSFPYAPLAALSSLPAVAWLAGSVVPRGVSAGSRERAAFLVCLPLIVAPLFFLPRLVAFYRPERTAVLAPRGLWYPPDPQGELFSGVVAHLARTGVADRSLVVFPEASAVGFLLGVRSPLRIEQILPGHVMPGVDADLVAQMKATRPERVVRIDRPTSEYGGARLGIDYATEFMSLIETDYEEEARFEAASPGGGTPLRAVVLRLRPSREPRRRPD